MGWSGEEKWANQNERQQQCREIIGKRPFLPQLKKWRKMDSGNLASTHTNPHRQIPFKRKKYAKKGMVALGLGRSSALAMGAAQITKSPPNLAPSKSKREKHQSCPSLARGAGNAEFRRESAPRRRATVPHLTMQAPKQRGARKQW